MKKPLFSHITRKMGSILLLIILCLFLSSAGCIQLPILDEKASGDPALPEETQTSSTPEITPSPEETVKQVFPPDMPPEIRERLIREGKIPSPGNNNPILPNPFVTPNPKPTSYVVQGESSLSEDAFIPSRKSIYFSLDNSWSGPGSLNPIYAQSGIPLNSTIKEFEVHVEKGPFSVRYTVHPKSTPLVSWVKITVLDSFQNIVHEDGYNREFSSEKVKECVVYKEGILTVRLSGGYATLDISINTPDGEINPQTSESKGDGEIPANMPPQTRERLMREGRI